MATNYYHYKVGRDGYTITGPVVDYLTISAANVLEKVGRVVSHAPKYQHPSLRKQTRTVFRTIHDFIDDHVEYEVEELLSAFGVEPSDLFDILWTASSYDQKMTAAACLMTEGPIIGDMRVPVEAFKEIFELSDIKGSEDAKP